ncbi:hypothetical protein N431DRAFT_470450 [Stipitochalara longipes BDJ]|nr:hypothetical protein N431DRAFT_470450 [Stipitochalara longipes BDJ]
MEYKDMTYAELRNKLSTRGLQAVGTKEVLYHDLLASEKSRFEKFGPLNDPDGSQRSAMTLNKSKGAMERAETRCKTLVARAEGATTVQLEKIEAAKGKEMAVLRQLVAEEKGTLCLGGSNPRPSDCEPLRKVLVTSDNVARVDVREVHVSQKMQDVRLRIDGVVAAGSRNLPIELDPDSPEESSIVGNTTALEPLHDINSLFVLQHTPEPMTSTTNTSPTVLSPLSALGKAGPRRGTSRRQMTPASPAMQTEYVDKAVSPIMNNPRKRAASNSNPDERPATRRQCTSPRNASSDVMIEQEPVLESIPEGTHYVFISADNVPVVSDHLYRLRMKLSTFINGDKVRADPSGYILIFGQREQDCEKARKCARYYNANIRFNGYELKMSVVKKA